MNIKNTLSEFLSPDKILCHPIHLHSYSRDASFYRLIPKAVIHPETDIDIQSIFSFANQFKTPLTFRGAGTSLSGQSITENILVDVSRSWKTISVKQKGGLVTCGTSVIGGHSNSFLRKYSRKIGPDPASINSCFIGGIIANNASGMCCGIEHNSYHTLHSMKYILPNGIIMDSSLQNADKIMMNKIPTIYDGILKIKNRIRHSQALTSKIKRKYLIKNTMGYTLNSFIDFDNPNEILSHLMVGSEGTLGFISEATLKTIPDPIHKATSIILFNKLEDACSLIPELNKLKINACEIMDYLAFKVIQSSPFFPQELTNLSLDGAALLCEFQSESEHQIESCIEVVHSLIPKNKLCCPFSFTKHELEQENIWKLRKEMLPCHAGLRKKGASLIIEDICVQVDQLAHAMRDLQSLFQHYKYEDAILFGHAKDGNLHFNITSDFSTSSGIHNYEKFMDDLVQLVVNKYNGSLKGEHSTGRNMAPFLEREWGKEATLIMKEIKQLIDPNGILNPDVIFTNDTKCHIKNIKPIPPVNTIIDSCIECGFCESSCPSKHITMTPRRRINILRELEILKTGGNSYDTIKSINDQLHFYLDETCAMDGLCGISCPVNINTGELVKEYREFNRRKISQIIAEFTSKQFQICSQILTLFGNTIDILGGIIGWNQIYNISKFLNHYTNHRFPILTDSLNVTKPYLPYFNQTTMPHSKYIYFPSCISRQFISKDYKRVPDNIISLCQKSGISIIYPNSIKSLCCGLPYSSKGFQNGYEIMKNKTMNSLQQCVQDGSQIITDNSPCALTLKHHLNQFSRKHVRVLDPVEFLDEIIFPNVSKIKPLPSMFLHTPCSIERQRLKDTSISVAQNFSNDVLYPTEAMCCGFAGDLGFFNPVLPESTGQSIEDFIQSNIDCNQFCSTSFTCELGLSKHTTKNFKSLLTIADECIKS